MKNRLLSAAAFRRAGSIVLIAVTVSVAAVVSGAAAQAPVPSRALSFEVGEQRSYRLGPAESLGLGESAEWSITLRSIVNENGQYVANFEFDHERFEVIPGSFDPAGGLMIVNVAGRLRTSLAGFPLWLEYTQEFDIGADEWADNGRRTIRFVYEGNGRYRKYVKSGRQDWDFKVNVPKYKHMDFDAPRGLYLYMPTAIECLGTSRATCMEQEPAFANPGFLSMIGAVLEETEESKRDFMFFMPGGLGPSPFLPLTSSDWLRHERNQISNMKRYFQIMKVELGTSRDVEVGPKTLHAWEVDLCCGVDHAYIEPGGRVVRVNLETTYTNADKRYIRLVFPFEEFLINEDPILR